MSDLTPPPMPPPPGGESATDRQYGPLTKSIDIEQTCMLLSLAHELGSVSAFKEEGLACLPQTSRVRRQEVVRLTLRKFLLTDDDRIVVTPFLRVMADPGVEPVLKRDLLYVQYLRSTPLAWEAVAEVVLPLAEAANPSTELRTGPSTKLRTGPSTKLRPCTEPAEVTGSSLPQRGDREIKVEDWNGFLERKLRCYTKTTFSRTRGHLTAHLTKFGLLEAERVEGDAIAKRFYARFTEPDPRAFLFGLAVEFDDHGWVSRSLDWVTTRSWTRIGFCTRPAYARFAVEQGEHWGVVIPEYFGSQRQVTLRGPDLVEGVADLILHPCEGLAADFGPRASLPAGNPPTAGAMRNLRKGG